jgi:hypothetical protein
MARARAFGEDVFGAQRVGLQQQFQQDLQSASRRAAAQGRLDDPILRARLLQGRNQAQERLGAQQTAFTTQQAQMMPQQRLAFQAQQAQMLQGLSNQARQNRLTLAGQGSAIQARQQAFRAAMATQDIQKGGGAAGAITGALGGFGMGAGAGSMISNAFGPSQNQNTGGQTFANQSTGGGGGGAFVGPPAPPQASAFNPGFLDYQPQSIRDYVGQQQPSPFQPNAFSYQPNSLQYYSPTPEGYRGSGSGRNF